MIERMQVDLQIFEGSDHALEQKLNDKVNEAYVLVYAISSFISPLIGSQIYIYLGMKKTFDIAAIINIVFVIYILR